MTLSHSCFLIDQSATKWPYLKLDYNCFGVFSPDCTLHISIIHAISVLEWWRHTHNYAIRNSWETPPFQYFYHVSDRRVQCAIGTKNPETTVFRNSTRHCWHCTSFATRPVVEKEGKSWHILATCREPLWRPLQCLSHLGCCPLDRNPASWCFVVSVFRQIARHAKISSLR